MASSGDSTPSTGVVDMSTTALRVLDTLGDAVVVADRTGSIVYVNPAIERVLQWQPAALLGQPISILVPARLLPAHRAGFEDFVRTGASRLLGQPTNVLAMTASGTEHPIELVLSALTLHDGTRAVVASLRDVSDRVGLERQSSLANHLLTLFTRDLPVEDLVEQTMAALGRLFDMPAAAFWAPSPAGTTLRCAAFWRREGLGAALESASRVLELAPGDGLAGRVWASHEPAWIRTLSDDANFLRQREVALDGLRSALAVPVRTRRQVLGVIELYAITAREPDAELLQQMATVGRRLGEVLYSTRLEEERRQLADRERAVAAAFRESLLPDSMPHIEDLEIGTAFAPGGEGVVGGDFYDVYPLAEVDGTRRWGVTIGDVCGTGPEAAAITSKVRYTARALTRAGLDLVSVGEHINTAMSGRRGRRFCTGIIGRIEARGDDIRLRMVNAGHPPPIVRRADGTVEVLPTAGSLLGALPGVALVEQAVDIAPGDVVLLHTDGVTEARRGGELFGEARLAEVVGRLGDEPAATVAKGVQESVQRFADSGLADDVAILVLRRPPRPAG